MKTKLFIKKAALAAAIVLLTATITSCNTSDLPETAERGKVEEAASMPDGRKPLGYVLDDREIRELADKIPSDFSGTEKTYAADNNRNIKEIKPFNDTRWGGKKAAKDAKAGVKNADILDRVYVVNYEGDAGFAIVSADNRLPEVLAYSEHGNLTDTNDNPGLEIFLSSLGGYVKEEADAVDAWLASLPTDSTDGGYTLANPVYYTEDGYSNYGPVISTQWGYWEPFNLQCLPCPPQTVFICDTPVIQTRCPAGCVATAMAQIMGYHQFPNSVYSDTLAQTFTLDWGSLPNEFNTLGTGSYYNNAIASLFRKIGNLVYMNYTPSGSSSNIDKAKVGFNSMGFTSTISSFDKEAAATSIKNVGPIFMKGVTQNAISGHAWVGAGYKTKTTCYYGKWEKYDSWGNFVGYVIIDEGQVGNPSTSHIYCNWGWYGDCDGFYVAGVFNPDPLNNFTRGLEMLYNIHR